MGNRATLQPNVFSKDNQPEKKGRPKGVPNRATVFKKLLQLMTKVADPADPKNKTLTVSLYEAAALGQIKAAMNGSANAWKEIQDSIHGKMTEKIDIEQRTESTSTIIIQGVKGNDGAEKG